VLQQGEAEMGVTVDQVGGVALYDVGQQLVVLGGTVLY